MKGIKLMHNLFPVSIMIFFPTESLDFEQHLKYEEAFGALNSDHVSKSQIKPPRTQFF